MGKFVFPNVFIFVTEKEHHFQKNENIALLHLRRKKKNTSFIWTHTGIVSIVWILLSRNEMHRCHAYCCLLRSRRLVSSHNAIYSQLERDSVAWRDQITVAKADYIYCRSSNREKIIIICLQLVAKKVRFAKKEIYIEGGNVFTFILLISEFFL